ncbi:dolichyl-diphosphooligosaccharide--protein glycosyltransferase subunit 1-like [Anneissia japonica]|uniref:dolichyl-diphosphooligosaccharide--protein glycosyltransferase subunit 1-like n=1 Tax=Anneissia japonica TaxID=1529436 RepID=UPI0014257582|nr:dolichyl-diphosphooligosaccharide--protein glycosyltransferase subunit 1-like [Anneissia japonica]
MHSFSYSVILICSILATVIVANQDGISTNLENKLVSRKIDLESQLVKITTKVTVANTGSTPTKLYVLAVDAGLSDNLASVVASSASEDEGVSLSVAKTSIKGLAGKVLYRVTLDQNLVGGGEVQLVIEMVFSNALRPYPTQITQKEKQFVEFTGNGYFYSPYKTKSQTTEVQLSSSSIEYFSKLNPVAVNEDVITFGPYEDIAAFTSEKIRIHYENNNAFLTITSMTRVVEVSHWGNIAVEETFDIRHVGAKLKGSFSRYDYQRSQEGASVKSYKTILPASATDVYYRDEIGNISTSHLVEHDEYIELELRPRFPLFGGWKTHYYMGYNLPSYEYLYSSGDDYILRMRFVDHVFDAMVVDDLTVKIILPEGSKNMKLVTPYSVDQDKNELHFTYLDTIGRPVIVARKSNLVEQHIQDFELHYSQQRMLLLQEPLLVVGAFYLLFLTVIVLVRLDFSITKDEANETRMKVASLVEQVIKAQDTRSELFKRYEKAITDFKSSKSQSAFQAAVKKINTQLKEVAQNVASIQASVKQQNEVAEKISELQKFSAQAKELAQQSVTNAEKLVSGKFSKQQYLDQDKVNKAKREDVDHKIQNVLASL